MIKINRKLKGIPRDELAESVGVSRSTLQRIEAGDPRCEVGLVIEAAHIVGIDFTQDGGDLKSAHHDVVSQVLRTLPMRTSRRKLEDDNDF